MLDLIFLSAIAGVLPQSLKREEERWQEEKFHNFRLSPSSFLSAINCLLYLPNFCVFTVNKLQKESLVNNSHDSGVDSMNTNSSGMSQHH